MKIYTIKIFVFLIFIFYSLVSYPQSKTIDSLNKVLQTEKEDTNKVNTSLALCRAMRRNADYANAMKIAKAALFLAKDLNFKDGEARVYDNIAFIFQYQDNYKAALENFSNALNIRLELRNKASIGYSYISIANIYYYLDNYPEGLRNAFLGLKFMEETGDKENISNAYNEIGFLYYCENNIVKTQNYYSLALKLAREVKDTSNIAEALNKIGIAYFKEGNYDEAMKNYMEALHLMKDTVTTFGESLHANVFSDIGDVYKSKATIASLQRDKGKAREDFYKALENYFSALQFIKKTHHNGGVVFVYTPIGEVYIKLGKLAEAKEYVKKAVAIAKETRNKDYLTESYRGLFELDSATKNYKQAFEDHKMYIVYRDSLNNSGTAQQSLA